MSTITSQIIKVVRDDPDNKIEFKDLMKEMKELNTGSKAELATKLIVDREVLKKAVNIMGTAINDAEIEIEALETKNNELEKELNPSQREKINKLYQGKKEELTNDNQSNERIWRRLNKVMLTNKQLTEK
jgi:hypothetical protein